MRKLVSALVVTTGLTLLSGPAHAQDAQYPSRPVRFIIGFAPGLSGQGTTARAAAPACWTPPRPSRCWINA